MELKFTISIPEEVREILGINDNTLFESYFENGSIVVTTLNEEDFEDFIYDEEDGTPLQNKSRNTGDSEENDLCTDDVNVCDDCPYYYTNCGNATFDE
ncbi:MAG: hypothetical protein ACYCWE_00030 [Eubacteriales bacterium]